METCDGSRQRRYRQVFKNNMGEKCEPVVTKCKPTDNWTCITFKPDLAKFNMTELEDDTVALMCKRVYDAAGNIGKNTKVFLNGDRLKIKGFSDYVDLYLEGRENAPKIMEKVNDRWEVCVTISDTGNFQQVSFVNGICTMKGGTHVNQVADEVAGKLLEKIKKKEKSCKNLKAAHVKNHLWVFVNALIENPAFDSQTKETLNTRASNFGSKYESSDKVIKQMMNSGIVEQILSWASFKQSKEMKKSDGKKATRLTGIPKLDDANDAGGRNSEHCTLILTEGDSAKALAVSGLSVVGRDRYGVFPLRGKLLNVRDASHDQIMNNAEINHIKQILGLRHGTAYESAKSLRYGHIMIMTDQDHDGSHIKGLLINFLHAHFPSLLKIPGFLVEFITPIIKATKGKNSKVFYTLPEYDNWKEAAEETGTGRGWHIKYYKGLGTSTAKEAKEYFAELDHHKKTFLWSTDGDGNLIDMAFAKKRVEDRKAWLNAYEPGTYLDMTGDDVRYDDFINKELILFSRADLMRSIPSVVDGFKPSQRKVLFSCFKRKLRSDIKVAQLSGYVSEHSAYHHGEASLASTIVGLAQDFVGSNNVNLLVPSGQFGTRLQGGKDHASPRYIFTRLAPICRVVFPECDDALLDYLDEDGQVIEPEYYLPIMPLLLVNGADGIGTGWSTSIPNFNPRDIVANIRRILDDECTERMHPWYRNFHGTIDEEIVKGEIRYNITGKYEIQDECTLVITELPLRSWTTDYKDFLENMLSPKEKNATPFITAFREHHTDTTVHFIVTMTPENMAKAQKDGIEKKFKLCAKVSTSNMHAFDAKGAITKYSSPEAVMETFVPLRLDAYARRRAMLIRQAEFELKRMSNKARFILAVVDGEITIGRKKKSVLIGELESAGYDRMPKTAKAAAEAEPAESGLSDISEEGTPVAADGASYDYLLSMPLWNLTQEKVDELLEEQRVTQEKVEELHMTTDKQLWIRDLDAFDAAMDVFDAEDAKAAEDLAKQQRAAVRNQTKGGKKALAKKKKASRVMDSDEEDDDDEDFSDDEFMPTKAKAKKPAAPAAKKAPSARAKKPAAKAASSVTSASEAVSEISEAVSAPTPAPEPESDDEFDAAPKLSLAERLLQRAGASSAAAAAPKPAPAKKAAPAKDEFDFSDSEADSEPAPVVKKPAPAKKPAAVKKPAAAKKAAAVSDDEFGSDAESDVEVVAEVAPRAASSRGGAAARKVYAEESSDEEEEESDFEDDGDDSDFE